MLLVTQINMIEEWALSWQESTGKLKRFRMPELGLFLFYRSIKGSVLLHLNDEPYLGRVAEVCYSETTHFLDE